MLEDSIIASQDEEIRKLLIFQYHYTVPKFQREYSWIDEHVEEFMDDLMQHLKDNKNEHYFFGSIYLCRTNDKNMWIVVDGQQRLATTMIFLVVVRFMEYFASTIQYELDSCWFRSNKTMIFFKNLFMEKKCAMGHMMMLIK